MLKKILGFFVVCISFAAAAAKPMYFDHMAVFGDSLSDNGNLYNYSFHMMPKSPPYFKGRFSNGPVWSEMFANSNSISNYSFADYAVGGAGAILSSHLPTPYTLSTELDKYLSNDDGKYNDSTLYVVWIGANNYLSGAENVDEITTDVVNGIGEGIERLVKVGATMIVIGNLPDLGVIPESKRSDLEKVTHELAVTHNEKLWNLKERLVQKYPNVRFVYFDAFDIFNKTMQSPGDYGITDITHACYEGGYFFSSRLRGLMAVNPAQQIFVSDEKLSKHLLKSSKNVAMNLSTQTIKSYLHNPILREAIQNDYFASKKRSLTVLTDGDNKCDGYLFWDHVHPTTHTHKIINSFFKKVIAKAQVIYK